MPKIATLETAKGTIRLTLFEKDAPKTVANFEKLITEGFYDGVTFHRVVPNFVIQGGDPLSKTLAAGNPRIGTGGPGYTIKCETAGNPNKHTPGTLSMASLASIKPLRTGLRTRGSINQARQVVTVILHRIGCQFVPLAQQG